MVERCKLIHLTFIVQAKINNLKKTLFLQQYYVIIFR
jgi:hypothetical protein